MKRVQFRAARPEDAEILLEIKRAAIGEIDSDQYTAVQIEAWRPTRAAESDFKRAIQSEQFEILLAESARQPVAYGVLNTECNRIDALFVHPKFANEGVGSSLVRQFESRARMEGIKALEIVASLNAKSFYESLGYLDCGRKTRTIRDFELEFAIMRKEFDLP